MVAKEKEQNPPSFLQKLNALRADACSKDWTPTGVMRMGAGPAMKYISISQMKANLAPLFSKNGLEFKINMMKPEALPACGSLSQHWLVGINVVIMDTESDESEEYTFYGEGADTLDKGIAKAVTYALKTMLASVFLIADGMDPESDTDTTDVRSTYVPKTPAQKMELKDKLKSPAPAPKTEEKPVVKEVPKEETPKETPAPAPKTEEKPAPVKTEDEPEFTLPTIHRKAIAHILEETQKRVDAGLIGQEVYAETKMCSERIRSVEDAKLFIKNHKV